MARPGLALCSLQNEKEKWVPCTLIREYKRDGKVYVLVEFASTKQRYVKPFYKTQSMAFKWRAPDAGDPLGGLAS